MVDYTELGERSKPRKHPPPEPPTGPPKANPVDPAEGAAGRNYFTLFAELRMYVLYTKITINQRRPSHQETQIIALLTAVGPAAAATITSTRKSVVGANPHL